MVQIDHIGIRQARVATAFAFREHRVQLVDQGAPVAQGGDHIEARLQGQQERDQRLETERASCFPCRLHRTREHPAESRNSRRLLRIGRRVLRDGWEVGAHYPAGVMPINVSCEFFKSGEVFGGDENRRFPGGHVVLLEQLGGSERVRTGRNSGYGLAADRLVAPPNVYRHHIGRHPASAKDALQSHRGALINRVVANSQATAAWAPPSERERSAHTLCRARIRALAEVARERLVWSRNGRAQSSIFPEEGRAARRLVRAETTVRSLLRFQGSWVVADQPSLGRSNEGAVVTVRPAERRGPRVQAAA
eukprot:scaffold68001_cov59-Phaeocystis_antarctica.AAC.2